MKKIFPYLFAIALFFIGGADVFAYDFAHWKGATVTDFSIRFSSDEWKTNTSNSSFVWVPAPRLYGDLSGIYQFGGMLQLDSYTLKKGTATIQLALGHDAESGVAACSWINSFATKSLEYSSNKTSWGMFNTTSFNCTSQGDFIIIGYNVTIPSDITFTYLSFGVINDDVTADFTDTLFSAVNIISSEDGTEAIINQNQTIIDQNNTQIQQGQETNENLEDIKDAITDDSIDVSTGNSFFDDFEVSDNGGISSIVTAPLSAIEKMVSGTCSPIKGSYRGKEFSFPCGDTFWSEMPEVKQFLNIVLGGFLCYGILAKLYLLIDRLKDPEDDRVDVMKL